MTEFDIRKELEEKRSKIESFDDLLAFLKDVKDNYNPCLDSLSDEDIETWYGGCPRAVAQAILATGFFFSKEMGLTGFQAHCTLLDFLFGWEFRSNKTGLRIVNWDDMLYPQSKDIFQPVIKKATWGRIQEEAKRRLAENELLPEEQKAHPEVAAHWKSIADGVVPFGYQIEEGDEKSNG